MPKKRFSAEQIVTLLRQIEVAMSAGKSAQLACREAGISEQSFYRWVFVFWISSGWWSNGSLRHSGATRSLNNEGDASKAHRSMLNILAVTLCGCTDNAPSQTAQICLENRKGLSDFESTLKSIAHAQHMKYIDDSVRTRQGLRSIGALDQKGPFIYLGVEREDGMGLTAGNLGLPGYQVAIGFSKGSDAAQAAAFSDSVIRTLSAHWHVVFAPAGKGAFPLRGCV